MKYIGIIVLICSSTGLGYHFYKAQRDRLNICKNLLLLCDSLIVDLNYSATPIRNLLTKLINDYNNLDFIDLNCLKTKKKINSSLINSENDEISKFLYSLGKSDLSTQIKLINGFKEYLYSLIEKYQSELSKKGKLSICFGSFVGIVISIILL